MPFPENVTEIAIPFSCVVYTRLHRCRQIFFPIHLASNDGDSRGVERHRTSAEMSPDTLRLDMHYAVVFALNSNLLSMPRYFPGRLKGVLNPKMLNFSFTKSFNLRYALDTELTGMVQ